MQPSPSNTESTPPVNGVAVLMADIAFLRQQLVALNKRPLPATEKQVKDLTDLAARDRPLEVKVQTEEVVEQLVGKVEQLTEAFLAKCDKLITLVDDRTDYLAEQLRAGVAAVNTATAAMTAGAKLIPGSVPVKGKFYGFTNWQSAVVVAVISALLGALSLWAFSSKVSKEDYEQLQAKNATLQVKNKQFDKEGVYYKNQITAYRKKNPKTTDFPVYEPAE